MYNQNILRSKFLVDNYSQRNDSAIMKNVRQKIFRSKLLVDNYSPGNDFATIKNFLTKNISIKIFSG